MNNYQSIATINGPEFINLQPLEINPGMAQCEIKVLYLGSNRNGTSISKDALLLLDIIKKLNKIFMTMVNKLFTMIKECILMF